MLQSKFFVNSPLVYGTIQSVMELTNAPQTERVRHASDIFTRLKKINPGSPKKTETILCRVWGINPGMTNLYLHKLATTSATAI